MVILIIKLYSKTHSLSFFLLFFTSNKNSSGKGCLRQIKPDQGSMPAYPGVDIVKSIISKMEKHVELLDITLLTQLRRDGHPSIYTGRGNSYVDCSHWCLAGVPDTWNQMLYATLLEK